MTLVSSKLLASQVEYCMRRASDISPACMRFQIGRARSLALQGKYGEAQTIAVWVERGCQYASFVMLLQLRQQSSRLETRSCGGN